MRLIFRGALAAMLIAAAGAAQAAPRLDTLDALQRELQSMSHIADNASAKEIDARVQPILASPAFGQLEPLQRCAINLMAGGAKYGLNDFAAADRYMIKAVECPEMPKEAWLVLYAAALQSQDWDSAAKALLVRMERYPSDMGDFDSQGIAITLSRAAQLPDGAERKHKLLDALFDSNWKPSEPGFVMDAWWAELAAGLVDRGLTIRAGRVAQKISNGRTLAKVRADKRFDDLFDHAAAAYDPEQQSVKSLETIAKQVADNPRSLETANLYAMELMLDQHPDTALKLLDGLQARIAAAPKGKPAFDDLDDQQAWVKDYRQRALFQLGREDEALAMEIDAVKSAGDDKVSQVVNLGDVYNRLGRPREALTTVDAMGDGASPYGLMQREGVRAMAYAQLGDKAGLAKSLDYLKAHEADAPAAVVEALLAAGELDAVAAAYIRRLADPAERLQALDELQRYAPALHQTAVEKAQEDRREALRNRPDLKAAVDKVGRINRYSFQGMPG